MLLERKLCHTAEFVIFHMINLDFACFIFYHGFLRKQDLRQYIPYPSFLQFCLGRGSHSTFRSTG